MGDVYLAADVDLGRPAALKFLNRQMADSDRGHQRFEREAKIISNLNHPHIATVYVFGRYEEIRFFAMEYLPGGTLGDLLKERRKEKALLPVESIIQYAQQVAAALKYAHDRNTIHSDLKHDNVMLTEDGVAKVTDFGLAKIISANRESNPDMRIGTPAYMSPEQVQCLAVDHRSDIYSFGVLLFELASLQVPFHSEFEVGLFYEIVNTPAPSLSSLRPELPAPLPEIVDRALAKDPEQRFASIDEVLALLEKSPAGQAGVPTAELADPEAGAALAAGSKFVGRVHELACLEGELSHAFRGRGRMVLLSGDAGSGKTRTIEVFSERARRAGAGVLSSYCHEVEGAPPFWPWTRIIRAGMALPQAREVIKSLGSKAQYIQRLAPEPGEGLQSDPNLIALDPSISRFRLFESILAFLAKLSVVNPLVIIVDDLHWGDEASLKLLSFLGAEIRNSRILLIGSSRSLPARRDHPLTQALGRLARMDHATRIALRGLEREDVGKLVELEAGAAPPEDLVEVIVDRTAGNPFFVSEIAKILPRLSGDAVESEVPGTVREAVQVRLSSLSSPCGEVLAAAAVVGRNFTTLVLEELGECESDALLSALDEAEAARLIVRPEGDPDVYAFSHAIVRDAIHGSLTEAEKRRLHRSVARALEAVFGTEEVGLAGDLANHYARAGGRAEARKAITYAEMAARLAAAQLAHEDAGEYFMRAADLLDRYRLGSSKDVCESLLRAGAEFKRAGTAERWRDSLERAAEFAQDKGLTEQLARAAMGLRTTLVGPWGVEDPLQLRLLRQALDLIPDEDSIIRTQLLSELSAVSLHNHVESRRLSAEALAMARRIGHDDALVAALGSRHAALLVTEDLPGRKKISLESLELALKRKSLEEEVLARYRLIIDYMEIGEVDRAAREVRLYVEAAAKLRQPRYVWLGWFLRAILASFLGDLRQGEELNARALQLGERTEDPTVTTFHSSLFIVQRSLRGTLADLLPLLEKRVSDSSHLLGHHAVLAYGYWIAGRPEEARQEFEVVAKNDFADLVRDGSFFVTISAAAWLCLFLKDAARARSLYDLAIPFAGRNISMGGSPMGLGSIHRVYGHCAMALGELEDAIAQYRRSLDMNRAMKAQPFVVGSRCELAIPLALRGRPEDLREAKELLAGIDADAREIGMGGVLERLPPALRALLDV